MTTITSSRLTTVFSAHRIIAGLFGAALILFPTPQYELAVKDMPMPWQDRLLTQSWGCTILMVAWIAHCGRSFPVVHQRLVGRSLELCFAILTVLYILIGSGIVLGEGMPEGTRIGVLSLLPIFVMLLVAYAWALQEIAPVSTADSFRPPGGHLAFVFRYHRWIALVFGMMAVFAPSSFYWPFPGAINYSTMGMPGEIFVIQSWGCFIIAAAGIAHSGLSFNARGQQAVAQAMLLQFALLTCLYLNEMLQGELDDMYTYGGLPIFVFMTVVYSWGLSSTAKSGLVKMV